MRATVQTRSQLAAAIGALLVCMALIIGWIARAPAHDVIIYDDRFEILFNSVSEGKMHTVYNGNQLLGRIRDTLSHHFSLSLPTLSPISVAMDNEHLAFLIRYAGDLPYEDLHGLRALLTNGKEFSRDLGLGVWRYDEDKHTFIRCYGLSAIPTNQGPYRIVFALESAKEPIAEWRVGNLR